MALTLATTSPDPAWWGLERRDGRLVMDGHDLTGLAERHGTPLHVASARTLRRRVESLAGAFAPYRPGARMHFSYKTNPVAGVLRVLHEAGVGAEVVDGYELWLARRLGVPSEKIVLNGPNKSDAELDGAVRGEAGLVVVDGFDELARLAARAAAARRTVPVALRICPGVVPRGLNMSAATGSRRQQFGFDAKDGEVDEAIRRTLAAEWLVLRGMMAHIGSGIHDVGAFGIAVDRLLDAQAAAAAQGAQPDLLDIGGGLGTAHSRELTTTEMLAYLGFGRLPRPEADGGDADALFARYAGAVTSAITAGCAARRLPPPTLVLEPGRALVSDAQVLLLTVGTVRERAGIGRFAIADGGAMTVSLMFLSEVHALLLANRDAPPAGRSSLFGRLPSPMDVVYRNAPLPALAPGDVVAVMDAGAYFTSTATNFGGPRPGVVLVDGADARLVRRPETFEDLARVEVPLAGDA